MHKFDLGWGDPYFLLEILGKTYTPRMGSSLAPENCTYAPDLGDEELLMHIKGITEHTTGETYEHYMVTNGATQAINTVMRVWKKEHFLRKVVTSKLGYPFYEHMITKNGIAQYKKDLKTCDNWADVMYLIDSPSNPLGEQLYTNFNKTIWDAVYHNKIYNACPAIKPKHDVYVGSFSKILGLTGARVGWIATNNEEEFELFNKEALYENATVSKPSQKMVKSILQSIDLIEFMKLGKNSLDQNREELQKLSSLLGTDVQEKGMFYCAEVDTKMLKLFDNAGIKYVKFDCGINYLIRLNIGQTNAILKKAVKAVQKADRRK